MWRLCCHRRDTWWSDSGSSSTVHWSSWHLSWPPWPRTRWRYAETQHLNNRATGSLLVDVSLRKLRVCMNGSLTGLLGFFFIRSRRLDIDRSTWVLVVICYPRVIAARLGPAVVHWKRKILTRGTRKRIWNWKGTKDRRVGKSVCTRPQKNCWSLCQSSRLYLGVRRRRTSWRWTRRTRGSPGWYPRRSQTCKNLL